MHPLKHSPTSRCHRWPRTIRYGNRQVTVYKVTIKHKVYYQIADYSTGRRILHTFNTAQRALEAAQNLVKQPLPEMLNIFTEEELQTCIQLKQCLDNWHLPFVHTVNQWLREKEIMIHMARFRQQRIHPLAPALQQYLEKQNISHSYKKSLSRYLWSVLPQLPARVEKITNEQIWQWTQKCHCSPKTRLQYYRMLRRFLYSLKTEPDFTTNQ